LITIEAAEISAQRVMAEAYQFCSGHRISNLSQKQPGGAAPVGVNRRIDGATHIPTNSESQRIIDITGAELRDGTREREPSGHLTQALHHSKDRDTSEGISKQDRERTGTCKSTADTQEETRTDGTSESNELDMSRFQSRV
jgi:hypothetical protein